MATRRSFIVLRGVLLALLVVCVAFPSTPALGPAPMATVAAAVDTGHLVVDVDASPGTEVTLVITHDDPIVGDVVDRVVPMDLAANASLRAAIADARFDVDLTVRVLNGTPDLPRLPDVGGLLDPAKILEIPEVARIEVPAIPPEARSSTVRVPVYPLPQDVYSSEEARLYATPQGHVALLALDHGSLWIASSQDGGRTFSSPLTLAERPGEMGTVWYAAAATPDDRIVVLVQPRESRENALSGPGWRLLTIEPGPAPRVASDVGLGQLQGLRFDMYAEQLLPTKDGLLLAFAGGVANGSQEWAPVGLSGGPFQVWSVGPDGTVGLRGTTTHYTYYGSSRVVASPSGERVAVVGGRGSIIISRSDDGGRTFSSPAPVDGILPSGNWIVDVTSAALDDAGTVHLVAMGRPHSDVGGPVWFDGWYARVPLVGPVVARSLAPTVPREHLGGANVSIYWPELVVVGPRVTVVLDSSAALYETHSLDGGLTWSASIRLEGPRGYHQLHLTHSDGLGVLPDGRPVLATYAGDARYPPHLATVLPYDPLPSDVQGLVAIGQAADALTGRARVALEGPHDAVLASGGNASLYYYARNDGDTEARADVVLRGLPPHVSFLTGMTRLVLGPRESGDFGLMFHDEGASPASVDVTLVLRDDGRDVSMPHQIHLAIGGSALPPESEPQPEPTTPAPTRRETEEAPSNSTRVSTPIVIEDPIVTRDPSCASDRATCATTTPATESVPGAGAWSVSIVLAAVALCARVRPKK